MINTLAAWPSSGVDLGPGQEGIVKAVTSVGSNIQTSK